MPLLVVHFHRLAPAALLLNLAAVPLSRRGAAGRASLVPLARRARAAAGAARGRPGVGLPRTRFSAPRDAVRWRPRSTCASRPLAAWAVGVFVARPVAVVARRRRPAARSWPGSAPSAVRELGTRGGDGRLHVTFLDVGQGDAIVRQLARAAASWLVDAGGSFDGGFDVGEAVVAPYLWSRGVRRLDGVVVTHAHPDHAGGVPFLLARLRRAARSGRGPRPDGTAATGAGRRRARGRRSRGGPSRAGVTAEWDGVERARCWAPRRRAARPGARATTTRSCWRSATAA